MRKLRTEAGKLRKNDDNDEDSGGDKGLELPHGVDTPPQRLEKLVALAERTTA